ncbi:hypothetical protein IFM89_016890 [Coptis chinensis]|uniref:Replication factor A C-terminal domain-containing protein n=1 Tax=Coptis chinensis TaxID=261450 RepID=A0A835I2V3_9MAGN|nr:hypothetical protein IFM89_016890 [Coptis chinensis]
MGTERYVRLSELTDKTTRCKVKVRVSRRWTLGSKDSLEMKKRFDVVLIDEQGNQIQAIVPKNHSNTFLNVLHEGHVYHIENFNVQTRTDSYRPVQHEYLMLIRWDTIVRGSSEAHPEIPKYNFDFVEFNRIRLLPKENQNLQDAYGTLEGVSELIFRKGLTLKEIFLKNSSATQIYVNLEIPEVLALQNSSTFKERNISMLQGSSSVERNMKERSLRNRKTLLQIVQLLLNAESVGQVFTCKAIIYDIVHDYAPFYKSCTKIDCRKKVIDKVDHYWCNNCNNKIPSPDARYQLKARIQDDIESTLITIFGDEAGELLKHPASELERLIESDNGIQTVKSIIDKIIGASIVFEIKISQYNIQTQGRYGFTANKVFQVDHKLDSHQIQEQIEQVTEPSQNFNNTFQAHPPDNMHKNNSTLMKEKQLGLPRSIDIPQSSNKNSSSKKPNKKKMWMTGFLLLFVGNSGRFTPAWMQSSLIAEISLCQLQIAAARIIVNMKNNFEQLEEYKDDKIWEGFLYYKPHFEQLFKESGNFSWDFHSRLPS